MAPPRNDSQGQRPNNQNQRRHHSPSRKTGNEAATANKEAGPQRTGENQPKPQGEGAYSQGQFRRGNHNGNRSNQVGGNKSTNRSVSAAIPGQQQPSLGPNMQGSGPQTARGHRVAKSGSFTDMNRGPANYGYQPFMYNMQPPYGMPPEGMMHFGMDPQAPVGMVPHNISLHRPGEQAPGSHMLRLTNRDGEPIITQTSHGAELSAAAQMQGHHFSRESPAAAAMPVRAPVAAPAPVVAAPPVASPTVVAASAAPVKLSAIALAMKEKIAAKLAAEKGSKPAAPAAPATPAAAPATPAAAPAAAPVKPVTETPSAPAPPAVASPPPVSAASSAPLPTIQEKTEASSSASAPLAPAAATAAPAKTEEKTPAPENTSAPSEPASSEPKAATESAKPKTTEDAQNESDNEGEGSDEEKEANESENDSVSAAFIAALGKAGRIALSDLQSVRYPAGVRPNEYRQAKKFTYDPDFLLQFRPAVPPAYKRDLSKVVTLEDTSAPSQSRSSSSRGGKYSGMSGSGLGNSMRNDSRMMRNSSVGSMAGGRGRNSSRRKGDRHGSSRGGPREEPSTPVEPKARGENAWVPRSIEAAAAAAATTTPAAADASADGAASTDGTAAPAAGAENAPAAEDAPVLLPEDEVERKVKSLLNKMTMENLQRITTKIMEIIKQSEYEPDLRTMKQVVDLTFTKAVDEPHWSTIYALFCYAACHQLHFETQLAIEPTNGEAPTMLTAGRAFRRVLVLRCQSEFEKGWADVVSSENKFEVMSDEYYAFVKAKRQGLGLIRFVGELFKNGMISKKVTIVCLQQLGQSDPTEDIVESMCKFLTTVGPQLEDDPSGIINYSMHVLDTWVKEGGLPSRLRFKILDVVHAREANWETKEADKGPKLLSEIHLEAERLQKSEEERKKYSDGRGGAFGREQRDRERRNDRQMDRDRRQWSSRREASGRSMSSQSFQQARSQPAPEPEKPEKPNNRFSALDID